VLSNTPPPQTQPSPGAPTANTTPASPPAPSPTSSDTSSTRNYELGREVAVTNASPGKVRRLSVAVALSGAAMAKAKPGEIDQIKQLVSAAVGADPRVATRSPSSSAISSRPPSNSPSSGKRRGSR
jgi:flagellar M-ring protein FliF